MKTLFTIAATFLALFSHAPAADSMRAFYFGNSLTGVTKPDRHEDLGKSAGKNWQEGHWLGAGWQLWQHHEELADARALQAVAESWKP